MSVMPPVACTKYVVNEFSCALGVKVAVRPSVETETVPVSVPFVPYVIGKVADVTVHGSTGLLNRSCTTPLIGAPVSVLLGLTLVTDGVVVSVTVPVVSEKVPGLASASPPTSVICEVVTIVYVVLAVRLLCGVNVTC